MNENTHVRMWTIFGTSQGNVEVCDRHITLQDIPGEVMWQANRCQLNGDIKVVKLTFNLEVEQPQPARAQGTSECLPVYGMPDLSRFYDEL
jgi:hypothetical protein